MRRGVSRMLVGAMACVRASVCVWLSARGSTEAFEEKRRRNNEWQMTAEDRCPRSS